MSAPSSASLRGLLLIGLAAVSWGTTGSVTAVLVAHAAATPLVIGAVRMLLAGAVLLVAARALTGSVAVARADAGRCAAMGVCMAAFQAAYFTAVTLSGIAVSALIAICSAPLLIAVGGAVWLGERITWRVALALALGVAGTPLLIVGPRSTADVSARFVAGAALALLAGAAYALYVVLAKVALVRSAPLPLAAVTFTVAALVLAPVLLGRDASRQIAAGWAWMAYLGVVTTAAAYGLHTVGLRHVRAAAAGIAGLLEPLTATLLGVLLFGERLGAPGTLGAVLVLGALAVLVTERSRSSS